MKYKDKIKKKHFKYILKEYQYKLNTGDIVAGLIKYKEFQGFLVDIGNNISGYLPEEEIQLHMINCINSKMLYIYTTREFFLVTYNIYYKKSVVSIRRLEYIRAWKRIQQLNLEDIVFKLKIQNINKGGIITHLEGIQAFIPNSHQYIINKKKSNISINKDDIKCKLLIANENNNEIILSQKSALLQISKHKFRIGELIYGIIVNIQTYGTFIDIYGILGLLHISEISPSYIKNIYTIFHIGKIIKVKIIHVNIKQGRLSVSIKNLKNTN
uniref:Ribosomal protein S1 n=1 Tax=Sphondylothamnion multifidum TaxID=193186 RepID=A0A4D6X0X3_9FLOR|nr:ribosomal protein S1 [Sphondylothamnion multifidum]